MKRLATNFCQKIFIIFFFCVFLHIFNGWSFCMHAVVDHAILSSCLRVCVPLHFASAAFGFGNGVTSQLFVCLMADERARAEARPDATMATANNGSERWVLLTMLRVCPACDGMCSLPYTNNKYGILGKHICAYVMFVRAIDFYECVIYFIWGRGLADLPIRCNMFRCGLIEGKQNVDWYKNDNGIFPVCVFLFSVILLLRMDGGGSRWWCVRKDAISGCDGFNKCIVWTK